MVWTSFIPIWWDCWLLELELNKNHLPHSRYGSKLCTPKYQVQCMRITNTPRKKGESLLLWGSLPTTEGERLSEAETDRRKREAATATEVRGSDGNGSSRRWSDRLGMRVWEWERARLRVRGRDWEWEGRDNVTVCLKFELGFFCVFGFFVCLKCFFEWCLRWLTRTQQGWWFPSKQTEFNELGLQE